MMLFDSARWCLALVMVRGMEMTPKMHVFARWNAIVVAPDGEKDVNINR